ncbi:hypothetical protein GCM10011583_69310 [Streptomyces camponoticapitis]|uniref:Uncharacterized protein n=1 Tax=Streptomyces camponoticapitis TaxID=1616125 RepID=A0ABQ2EW62_9ACTN|nr:hypothetical protein GCM10011583_69310 [Streptomyces camponoticapitis]
MEPADPAGGLDLTGEPGAEPLTVSVFVPDQLHRDRTPSRGTPEKHLPHAAFAKPPHQPVLTDVPRVTGPQRIHRSPPTLDTGPITITPSGRLGRVRKVCWSLVSRGETS